MQITRYSSAERYLERNLDFLEKEEAVNSLLLGLTMANSARPNDDSLYLDITRDDEPLFTAIKTKGRNLIVYGDISSLPSYAPLLLDYLQKEGIELPGIIGPKKLALQLGEAMKHSYGWDFELGFRQMVYRLEQVDYNPERNGQIRQADLHDIEKIAQWMHWFCIEAMDEDDEKGAWENARKKIQDGEVYLWRDPREVSMTCIARPTNNGISINYVYTPKEQRGKGYGTKLVAELSALMLAKGYQFCTLFTDLDNPTSNNIYQKIGYKPIREFRYVKFLKKLNLMKSDAIQEG